jgi:hypothetical protein
MCRSGVFVADFQFAVGNPATNYDYMVKHFGSYAEGSDWLASYENYTTADGVTGAFGEWYNYLVRSLTFAKILDIEVYAWLDAH